MLVENPRWTHLPADPRRIAQLYEATNQPLVQIPGRTPQSAQAVVAAVTNGRTFEPLVALTFQSGENVIYSGAAVGPGELEQAMEEALNFAESMGFIVDQTGWESVDVAHKLEVFERLPAFRAPSERTAPPPKERAKAADPLSAVARLFAAFCVLFCVRCSGMSAEQRTQAADIHQQLGDNLLSQGNPQEALKEYMTSLDAEESPEAHLGIGLIYTWSLGRPQDGEKEFKRALEMRPDYPEALTNLGALYLSRNRPADAIPLFQKASADPLYKSRVIAQSNLGWAYYMAGHADKAVAEIKGAVAVAPDYCQGWRQLGTIYSDQGKLEPARDAFGKYAEACPDVADAFLQSGKVLARLSRAPEARAAFQKCSVPKEDKDKPVAAQCAKYLRDLGAP